MRCTGTVWEGDSFARLRSPIRLERNFAKADKRQRRLSMFLFDTGILGE